MLDFWVHWVVFFQKHQEFLAVGKRSILLGGITQIEDRHEMQYWTILSSFIEGKNATFWS